MNTNWKDWENEECPKCGALPGEMCKLPNGKAARNFHVGRINLAEEAAIQAKYTEGAKRLVEIDLDEGAEPMESVVVDGADHPPYRLEGWAVEDVPRPKAKGPFAGRKKLPYQVRVKSYVWCDKHEAFHAAANQTTDGLNCGRLFWRRVYVETDDKKEVL